ncbi:MAG: PCMD domain-containing protein [Saprospiraceae bacterium]|nr:PCMD domain-containing protein [Saprospiraceae bacterium]MDW8484174.1 PCMD domain-containing protein [Saprospiraceae bacterium]
MEKVFFLVFLFGFWTTSALAQIPNAGFENWQSGGNYEYPTSWGTVAQATNGLAVTCEKSTDKYSGNFAARLFTRDLPFGRIPGLLFTGKLDLQSQTVSGGFAYDQRPERLTGYYKYVPGSGDSCAVFGLLTRTLPSGARDTVALFFWLGGPTANYAPFSAPLTYRSNAKPDTALIVISSSKNPAAPAPNSTMWVDELSFQGSVGAQEPSYSLLPVELVPNPASETLRLRVEHPGLLRVWVVESAGRFIDSQRIYSGEILRIGHLPRGTYFLLVLDDQELRPLGCASFQRL